MNDRTIVQHPNGYSGVLMGKSTMMIYDKDDNCIVHTCFRTPNTEKELYEVLETMPRFIEILANIEADRKTEPQRGCDADCHEDCAECARESEMWKAEQTEPNCSEKPNNCEPKICDFCRYYNSNIPCGSTPSACKKADKFAEEFVDGLKKLKPKTEPQTYVINPQEPTNDDKCFDCDDFFTCDGQCDEVEDEPQTDCAWK